MDVLKLVAVFAVLLIALKFKAKLFLAILFSIVATVALWQIPLATCAQLWWKATKDWNNLQVLLVLYFITFLQRLLERRLAPNPQSHRPYPRHGGVGQAPHRGGTARAAGAQMPPQLTAVQRDKSAHRRPPCPRECQKEAAAKLCSDEKTVRLHSRPDP